MMKTDWLDSPLSAVVFDCDGTLSSIEGIDELARLHGVSEKVAAMTAKAMGSTGIYPALYEERLQLVRPTREEVAALGQTYFSHLVPGAREVIAALQRLGKAVYIASAGLYPAVVNFAGMLGVPAERVFAVGVSFDERGEYLDYDRGSPLVGNEGKRRVIEGLLGEHPRIMLVGDGLNDFAARDLVTRFVGFGGVFYRENIERGCEFYLREGSLEGVLELGLTEAEALSSRTQ